MAYHYLWPEAAMLLQILVSWLLGALALWIVARIVTGIHLRGFGDALVATVMIAIVNSTIGWLLKAVLFPLTFLTLGLFLLIINAFLLKLASLITPGFRVQGFLAALIGSVVLTVLTSLLRYMVL